MLLISTQFVTSSEAVFVKFYQNSIVLLVGIQPPTHLVLENVSRLRKCVVSAKCICYMGKNIYSFKRSDKPKLFFQTILYSGKENKTFVSTRKQLYENQKYKTVPNWYLILIVQMIIWNGKIYKHFGDSAWRTSYGGHHLMRDFDLIRRDLVLETFRNKFSYLYHFIITSIHKFL